jgi:two-component system sensor histidine kinase KdpD
MSPVASGQSEPSPHQTWSAAGIFGLLIITALAIVPLTLTILHSRESDALVIDMAGRQRMLLERYMKEVLLAAQGRDEPYEQTRARLQERLHALIYGGPALGHEKGETIVLPGAPTPEIQESLLRQAQLLDAFAAKAALYLQRPHAPAAYEPLRDALLYDNETLLDAANRAVVLLTQYSNARLRRIIVWEVVVVVLLVIVASFQVRRVLRSEQALKNSQAMTLDALRQRDAVQSALLSSVSHDLRTPLTAIKAMVFGLDHPSEAPDHVRREFLQAINGQVDYLNRLVGNLLDMSRLEAGTFTPHREWHVADELVEAAVRRVDVLLAGRPFEVDVDPDVPPVYVDGVQIQQVLVNLLDNAIKFSWPGSPIRIAVSRRGPEWEVSVSNHGEGVRTDQLDRIFDRFYRAQSGARTGQQGLGLGLAICRGLIQAHGGRILAESVPGGQTAIRFWLPLTMSPSSADTLVARRQAAQEV